MRGNMTLTDKERSAMVSKMKELAAEHRKLTLTCHAAQAGFNSMMALNYEALAEVLAERKPFEAVA